MSHTTPMPDVAQRTLPAAFARVLADTPDAPLLLADDGAYTYAEAHDRALRLAGGLRALGVAAGDRVVLMLDNGADAALAWFATGLTRVAEVPVNTAYKGEFLSHVVNDCGAEVAVIEQAYAARFAAVAGDLRHLRTVVVRGGKGAELRGRFRVVPFAELAACEPVVPEPTAPGDLLAISYTSGTTGRSKGVRVPHAQAFTYAHWDEHLLGPGTTTLVTLPMFHLSGQWFGLYQGLITGARCVVRPRFSASAFWDEVRTHDVTYTLLLGAMAQMLLSRPARPDDADTPLEIACVVPLPPDLDLFRRRFGVELATVFGMTEVGCPIVAPPGTVVAGGAGRERPGYRCKVVDENDVEVPPGVVGELVVRPEVPSTVMEGYHNLPEQTLHTFRNLWLHTGDAFSRDENGEFSFRDRIKDALRRRGENISSFEVESVVNGHPAVAESAVVAVPSALTEDDLKVVVVLQPGATLDPGELIEYLKPRMPYFTVPRYVEVLGELPKTPTQKVQKAVLRADGLSAGTWDREAHGVTVGRD
ncbi:AMP-binding protein [Pseudonocardia sp. RS11V-5]|uniref:AMP-binding protein n=1 Tax=Pseudonocardia terrae TaxID=2905831 RepID=UPI001E4F4017|nr:AMP-binding protein [Pseudonocardia terrae]MCE3550644.1 AMP-binding protein [Pseudonocardia terrae]